MSLRPGPFVSQGVLTEHAELHTALGGARGVLGHAEVATGVLQLGRGDLQRP